MRVPFSEIFHLELFTLGGEELIKDTHHPSRGNARRRSGKNDYVFLPPETIVQRKKPVSLFSLPTNRRFFISKKQNLRILYGYDRICK